MMRVGVDTFTISALGLDPFQTLDFLAEHGFDGAQFGYIRGLSPSLDKGELAEIRRYADELGQYTHVSISSPNPNHLKDTSRESLIDDMRQQIEAAASAGWHELHSAIGSLDERFGVQVPWQRHLGESTAVIRDLAPVLRANGSRINLETHGDATTFELARLAESVGPDICGICLDTANVLLFGEDPVEAARRAAPYTHLTHVKDAILYFGDNGLIRQGRPPGEGILDWDSILPILAEYSPDLPLSIEDHKWIFECPIFNHSWYAAMPDLRCEEVGELVRLAWLTQQKILSGEIPDPVEYEAIPFTDQLEDRLRIGRDHLKAAVERLT